LKNSRFKRSFDYKWVIVVLAFLMIFVSVGLCSSIRGLFIAPMTEALGISRSIFSFNMIVQYITSVITSLFFGSLVKKLGFKKLICAGFVALFISMLAYASASGSAVLCIGGLFLGVGLGWTSTGMAGSIVNRWCSSHTGMLTGFVLAANGVGSALGTMIVTPIIYNNADPFSYRNAYLLVGAVVAATGILMAAFFRENPPQKTVPVPDQAKSEPTVLDGISFSSAVRRPYFYALCACAFLVALTMQSFYTVIAAHLKDSGFNAGFIASVISLCSITIAASKLASGIIYDRFGLRAIVSLCCVAMIVALGAACMITASVQGRIAAIVLAIATGVALPFETVLIPIYTADIFGKRDYTRLLGIFEAITYAGFALGVFVMNLCFDAFGSYNPAFVVCAFLMAAVLVTMNFVITASRKQVGADIIHPQQ